MRSSSAGHSALGKQFSRIDLSAWPCGDLTNPYYHPLRVPRAAHRLCPAQGQSTIVRQNTNGAVPLGHSDILDAMTAVGFLWCWTNMQSFSCSRFLPKQLNGSVYLLSLHAISPTLRHSVRRKLWLTSYCACRLAQIHSSCVISASLALFQLLHRHQSLNSHRALITFGSNRTSMTLL